MKLIETELSEFSQRRGREKNTNKYTNIPISIINKINENTKLANREFFFLCVRLILATDHRNFEDYIREIKLTNLFT